LSTVETASIGPDRRRQIGRDAADCRQNQCQRKTRITTSRALEWPRTANRRLKAHPAPPPPTIGTPPDAGRPYQHKAKTGNAGTHPPPSSQSQRVPKPAPRESKEKERRARGRDAERQQRSNRARQNPFTVPANDTCAPNRAHVQERGLTVNKALHKAHINNRGINKKTAQFEFAS